MATLPQVVLLGVLVVVFAFSAQAAEAPGVVNPHVRTDGSVDFRTVDSILDSLIDEGMTDEEKVLAVFHTVRRMFVHGPTPQHLAYDFHKVMHVLGTGACLSQATPLKMLYERLGYESQSWVHDGHHMMQVRYGGFWHCLDPHMNFYCYDRSSPPKIASIEQLQNDPTLAWDAVKEGRAGEGYLLCGDSPKWFAGAEGDWYLERDGQWPELTVDEPLGQITLRRGESYIRTWQPGRYWYKEGWLERDGCGPIHHCRTADRKDVVNWPLYEPHAWESDNGTFSRCWGVGRLVYKPDVARGHYPDAVVEQENIGVASAGGVPTLIQADVQHPARVVFSVHCPYVITAGELSVRATVGKGVSASVSVDEGKTWDPVPLERTDGTLTGTFVDEVNGSFAGYWLRLALTDGAAVTGLELTSHLQRNRFSLPHFVPGRNVVSVQADRFGSPVTVTYAWAEGPGWETQRSVERTFEADGEFEVQVAGPKYPRMESLTLSVSPSWEAGPPCSSFMPEGLDQIRTHPLMGRKARSSMAHRTVVYIGTYTRGGSEGMYVYRLDPSTGALEFVSTLGGVKNPSFLAIHPGRRHLYAVNEVQELDGRSSGAVSAFRIDATTGDLAYLNQQASLGSGPCHLTVDRTGRFVVVANYGGGSVSVLPIDDEGALGKATDFVQHVGSSVDQRRQSGPHAHSVTLDPTNRYVFAADLGLDKMLIYRLDLERGTLQPNDEPWVRVKAGAGPRHFAFHPDGRTAYLICEMDSTLIVFACGPAPGALREIQSVPTLPEGFEGTSYAADLHVAPSGKFVYGSNRGHDSIAVFRVDDETGRLTLVGHQPTLGRTPRGFAFDPTGDYLLVANQDSNTVVTFRVDGDTGMLTATGHVAEVPTPVCLKVLTLPE